LGIFGVLALVLACVGVYGVMSYAVAGRTGEIGIRIALGADRIEVIAMVLREMLPLVAVGIGLGIPTAAATTHLLQSLLCGLRQKAPPPLARVVFRILGPAFAGCLLPAIRAARIDPLAALRSE